MIDKRLPRKLNRSVDSRVLPKQDMSDALNVSISEDEDGNAGVIKPIKSNEPNPSLDAGPYPNDATSGSFFGDRYVLGKCIDDKNNVVYYFVCDNGTGSESDTRSYSLGNGIYAYDPDNYLPVDHDPEEIVPVFWTEANESEGINFLNDPLSFVKADITYMQQKITVGGKSYTEVPMLFFTDGKEEPYKLNVLRAMNFIQGGFANNAGPHNPNLQDWTKDFLFVCTKTPVVPLQGQWFNDEEVNSNEFIGVNGCQFAYQVVYRDGNESAISTYSDVYVPPGYLSYNGVSDIDLLNQQNAIQLTIPVAEISPEAEEVKILIRKGETGSWFVIDTVNPSTTTVSYNNTTINAAVPNDVQSKQFDNVPLSAETQTIIDNRLVYGNYEEGFDKVDTNANIAFFTLERGEDFRTYEIEVGPSTCPSPYDVTENEALADYAGAINKNAGFFLSLEDIEEGFFEGDFVTFSYTVKPRQNWHIYDATFGYHASPQMGDDFSRPAQGAQLYYNGASAGTNPPTGYWWMNADMSGASTGTKLACTRNGVSATFTETGGFRSATERRFTWNSLSRDPIDMPKKFVQQNKTDFGTSAGNPLIIQGGAVNIKCSFTLEQDASKDVLVSLIARVLDGERPGDEGSDIGNFVSDVDATDFNDVSYSFNLGLSQGSTFSEDSELAKLVCMATNNSYKTSTEDTSSDDSSQGTGSGGESGFGDDGRIPGSRLDVNYNGDLPGKEAPIDGFFLINKATVEVGVFRDETYYEQKTVGNITIQENRGEARERFGLYIKSITLDEDLECLLSCARRPWVGSRWWCFSAFEELGFTEGQGGEGTTFFTPDQDLLVNNVFTNADSLGFPTTNNVNRPVRYFTGGNVDWNLTGQFLRFRPDGGLVEGGAMRREENLYKGNVNGEDGPWQRMFGGMRLSSLAADPAYGDSASILNLVFGERHSNSKGRKVSCFSLVDGDCGPGGKGEEYPDDDKLGVLAWKNFALHRYKGDIPGQVNVASNGEDIVTTSDIRDVDHYKFGVDKLGSAAVLPFRGDFPQEQGGLTINGTQDYDVEQLFKYGWARAGGYGPALTNRTHLARLGDFTGESTEHIFSGFSTNFLDSGEVAGFDYTLLRPGYRDPSNGEIKFSSRQRQSGSTSYYTPGVFNPGSGMENNIEAESVTIFPTIGLPGTSESNTFADQQAIQGSYVDVGTFVNLILPSVGKKVTTQVPSIINTTFYAVDLTSQGSRTFKAGATHPFGVVYYDERGRASDVCPLGSGYAPWYSERPNNNYGPIAAIVQMYHQPPERATHFQFVYAGNTTVSRFVQYTTGGAFVTPRSSDEGLDGNIYVSLNYLQDNPISFSKSYGARSVEGASDIYTFREGDRLRVISFFGDDELESRVFPAAVLEFNIVDQVTLSKGTDNPLYDEEQDGTFPHAAKTGSFVVLENNPTANGFSYFDVLDGENDPDTFSHNWNKRCVVEIYSPKDAADEDSLVYYETSNVYPISDHDGPKFLYNGDTWFSRMPVNIANFDDGFKSLVSENEEGEENSEPNLLPYFLESQVFSYKVRNADVNGKGKFKLVNPDASQIRRSASLTYSDKNNPASKILSLTSFNPSKGQFKDMPSEFGDINGLLNNDDSIFCIQSNRSSSIPVNRNLITDLGNAQSLVAAKEVLGTEQYYSGNYGCDGNQESICQTGNVIYFASKSNRQVYRFSPSNGLQVISDLGMKSFFKELFEKAEEDQQNGLGAIKVVGGYDPYKDNYILSVYNVDPDALNVFISECEEVEEDDTDTGGGTDDGTDEGTDDGGTDDGGTDDGGDEQEEERVIESLTFSPDAILALEQIIRENPDLDFELPSDVNVDGSSNVQDVLQSLAAFGQQTNDPEEVQVFLPDLSDGQITLDSSDIRVDDINNPTEILLSKNAAYLIYTLRNDNRAPDNNRDGTVTIVDLLRVLSNLLSTESTGGLNSAIVEDGNYISLPVQGVTVNYQQ